MKNLASPTVFNKT